MVQFAHTAFSAAVRKVQTLMGTRAAMQRLQDHPDQRDQLSIEQEGFVRSRTSLYIATASAAGQPYIQHRGGSAGFVHVASASCLIIPEQAGNGQFITQGNLSENPAAMLFLMDYANRRRLKLWGDAFVSRDANMDDLVVPGLATQRQAMIVFHLKAWDENCPAHIPRRFDEATVAALQARIRELESQLKTRIGADVGTDMDMDVV